MATLKTPLLSLKASGRLADGPVYSSWNGRPYAKSYSVPTDPNTAKQQSQRLIFSFLTTAWPQLSEAEQNTWSELAKRHRITSANAFLKHNLKRWSRHLPPQSRAFDQIVCQKPYLTEFSLIPGPGFTDVRIKYSAATGLWGIALSLTATYPAGLSLQDLIIFHPVASDISISCRRPEIDPTKPYPFVTCFSKDGTYRGETIPI